MQGSVAEATYTLAQVDPEVDGNGRGDVIAMAFSPPRKGCTLLALVTADGCIDFHIVDETYELVGHTRATALSKTATLDWTVDGEHLCVGGGVVLPSKGRIDLRNQQGVVRLVTPETAGSVNADWSTWSSPYGYRSSGIASEDGDPNGVCCALRISTSESEVLAVGDDYGKLSIFPHPSAIGAKARRFVGHSASVSCLAAIPSGWGDDGGFVSGGNDGCVILWAAFDVPSDAQGGASWLATVLERLAPSPPADSPKQGSTALIKEVGGRLDEQGRDSDGVEELIEAPLEYISQLVGPSVVVGKMVEDTAGDWTRWPPHVVEAYQKPREGLDSLPVRTNCSSYR